MSQQEVGQHMAPVQGSSLVLVQLKEHQIGQHICVENCSCSQGLFFNGAIGVRGLKGPRDCKRCCFETKEQKLEADRNGSAKPRK